MVEGWVKAGDQPWRPEMVPEPEPRAPGEWRDDVCVAGT